MGGVIRKEWNEAQYVYYIQRCREQVSRCILFSQQLVLHPPT